MSSLVLVAPLVQTTGPRVHEDPWVHGSKVVWALQCFGPLCSAFAVLCILYPHHPSLKLSALREAGFIGIILAQWVVPWAPRFTGSML